MVPKMAQVGKYQIGRSRPALDGVRQLSLSRTENEMKLNPKPTMILTRRGTINAIGSTPLLVTLNALAISHSETSKARLGRKHMPR